MMNGDLSGFPFRGVFDRLYWSSNFFWLAGPEGDDAADRIVGRDADRHAVAWHDFDPEAAHPAAQLCEDFMSGVALHAIQPAAVHGHDRALHVDEIVFTHINILSHLRGPPGPRGPQGPSGRVLTVLRSSRFFRSITPRGPDAPDGP